MLIWLIFLPVGVAAGFSAGLFGVGGGLVIVPTLYYLWRFDPVLGPEAMHFAVATSLACIVVTSITSTWTHSRSGKLRFEHLLSPAVAVSLGAVSAVLLANWLPSNWLKMGFGGFALITCPLMLRKEGGERLGGLNGGGDFLFVGALIGHVSTLLGVSGGALTVPYLVMRGLDMRQAVVISSALAIPISIIGAVGLAFVGPNIDRCWGYVHVPAFVGISVVSIYFASCGARVSQDMDRRKLRKAFSVFLALVAIHMLVF